MTHRTDESLLRRMVFGGRWSEWGLSFVHLAFGLTLLLPGETLGGAAYADLEKLGGEEFLGFAFCGVGAVRLAALTRNGWWHQSPLYRYLGAAFGFVAFLVLAIAFAATSVTLGVFSTAVATYGVLAILDLGNAWRAAEDAGAARRAR